MSGIGFDFVFSGLPGPVSRVILAAGIPTVGNAFAEEMGELVHATIEGKMDAALDVHRKMADVFRLAFVEGNPAGVKALMQLRGMCSNTLRLPLVPVSTSTMEEMQDALEKFGGAELY